MKQLIYSVLLAFLLVPQALMAQFEIPKKPDFQTSVYDYAKLLSESDKSRLETKLVKYSDTTTTQIVIVIIESLKGEDIGILTPKWGHAWGVGGTEKDDNGVFIILARDERKIWISPGYGVEDRMTAGEVGEMTREVIIPYFKQNDYYGGLNAGTDAIFKMLNGKYKGTRKGNSGDGMGGIFVFMVIIAIIIIIAIASKRGGGGGRGRGNRGFDGSDLLDIMILSSLGRSSGGWGGGSSGGGWGGGSSGGGGFGGGFGGGGFSGGGAGGSW
ncbi:methanol dehydrogenase [Flavobacterium akiainvivens]|uniref:Methanol dehydrogenase n=1 Tax=Flavobacterium akiainvivens TaxID=1202724 RepID=A0A0M8MK45_9FLAO|nr:TPM domain-containing protein [Flavobacterium akiainvivens]KOS07841.1 methanol dehydrogenase [Flavobacterium akiainvivens]SFQ27373.1 uncharacterized protein SAMN05444144_102301 [Flavobacterium akiainvivens]